MYTKRRTSATRNQSIQPRGGGGKEEGVGGFGGNGFIVVDKSSPNPVRFFLCSLSLCSQTPTLRKSRSVIDSRWFLCVCVCRGGGIYFGKPIAFESEYVCADADVVFKFNILTQTVGG